MQRVTAFSPLAMALAVFLRMTETADPRSSPLKFTDYLRNMDRHIHDAIMFGLLAFAITVAFCAVVNHDSFGLEYTESAESQNRCLDTAATVGVVVGGYLAYQ
ncbi:hypothetical protein B0T14DRAFT_569326 [Immersiella caudata]|uniref:Uncharacterized protein n=1 Tax=Immersiella caudata TaxID=314043 RepID=A0AA39WD87_9PEZI|nr:hypothetical protein B0T14DRAFT_569326 [Immersiella caudata]